jgi:hypothetical protein
MCMDSVGGCVGALVDGLAVEAWPFLGIRALTRGGACMCVSGPAGGASDSLREILRDNQQFLLDQQAFSPMFVRFVYDTLACLAALEDRPGADVAYLRSQPVIEWATRFALQVVAHSAECGALRDFVDKLCVLLGRSPAAAKWFLTEAAVAPALVLSPLLTATDRRVRCNVARLLVEVRAPTRLCVGGLLSRALWIMFKFLFLTCTVLACGYGCGCGCVRRCFTGCCLGRPPTSQTWSWCRVGMARCSLGHGARGWCKPCLA